MKYERQSKYPSNFPRMRCLINRHCFFFLNFITDISLGWGFRVFFCPQVRDMDYHLLPYSRELD